MFNIVLDTTAEDVKENMVHLCDIEGIRWENVCDVCKGDAPAMLAPTSRLQAQGTHRRIQSYAFSHSH